MKLADYRAQIESRRSVFQLTVGLALLMLVAAGRTMEAQSVQDLVAESQALRTITQTRKDTNDFGFLIGPSDAHENSAPAEDEADRAVVVSSEPSCAMAFYAVAVDGCARSTSDTGLFDAQEPLPEFGSGQPISTPQVQQMVPGTKADPPDENVEASSGLIAQHHERPDRNLDIYYRNRREFSLDVGWHPVNIPFIYDFAVGDSYNMTPLKYTLVPIVASLRWHVTNVGWRWIFRGNMDFTFSGSLTVIPRGPETHYYSFDFGIRRNFVYRNWKVVPFFEQRGGAGIINAKEPLGVVWAQGQNLTFTYNMGAGLRYNIDSKYSFSAGMNYMHISNGYLSEPKFTNYGINVYGPMFGIDIRMGKPRHHASE